MCFRASSVCVPTGTQQQREVSRKPVINYLYYVIIWGGYKFALAVTIRIPIAQLFAFMPCLSCESE